MNQIINSLIDEFDTRDPVNIANSLGIDLKFENLGAVNGYYFDPLGVKMIRVNENLPEDTQKFVVAHELGHAILHEGVNYIFLNAFTEHTINRFEREANLFAAFLLISDEEVTDYKHLSVPKLMEMYNMGEDLIVNRFFV